MPENEQKLRCNALDKSGLTIRWCSDEEVVFSEGEEHCCVYHAPRGEKRKTYMSEERHTNDEFNEIIFKKIREAQKGNHECDLRGTILEEKFALPAYITIELLPAIIFNSAKFNNVNFERVKFSTVDFVGAEFKNVNFSYSEFETAFFYEAAFCNSARFEHAKVSDRIEFTETIFGGNAHFHRVEFINASFNGACFNQGANFTGAVFSSDTSFNGAEFIMRVYFDHAKFLKFVTFDNSFMIEPFFYETRFSSASFNHAQLIRARFSHAKIESADFHGTEFKYSADFIGTKFKGNVIFYNAQFKGKSDFRYSHVGGELIFMRCMFSEDFANFREIKNSGKILFQNSELQKTSFIDTDIRSCKFSGCEWEEKKDRYVLYDEFLMNNNDAYLKELFETGEKLIGALESLYRANKQRSGELHNQYDYSKWHMSEKEMQRRRLKGTPMGKMLGLYKIFSGYGEEPKRAFAWLIGFVLIGVIAISFSGIKDKDNNIYKADAEIVRFEHKLGHSYYLKFEQIPTTTLYALETLTYTKTPEFTAANNKTRTARLLGRILTTLQFTLFAFALRNRFRR